MNFSIQFRQLTGEQNLIRKSGAFSETTITVNGTLKESCSITDPVMIIAMDTSILTYNYATISAFNRHYFIRNIVSVRNGLWEVSMHVDVLYTYETEILSQSGVMARSSAGSLLIDDPFAVQSIAPTTSLIVVSATSGIFSSFAWDNMYESGRNDEAWTYILSVYSTVNAGIADPTDDIRNSNWGAMSYKYVLNGNWAYQIQRLILLQTGETWGNLNIEPSECIISLKQYPISLSSLCKEDTFTIEIAGEVISSSTAKVFNTDNTPSSPNAPQFTIYNGLIDYEDAIPADYTKFRSTYKYWVPFYGWFEIDANSPFTNGICKYLWCEYNVSLNDGDFTCLICCSAISPASAPVPRESYYVLGTVSGNMAIDIPLSRTNAAEILRNKKLAGGNVAQSTLVPIFTSLAMFAMHQPALGVAGLAGAVVSGSVASAREGITQGIQRINMTAGAGAGLYTGDDLVAKLLVIENPVLDNRDSAWIAEYGLPDYQYRNLSSLSNYGQCAEIHLVGFNEALSDEINEIETLLKSGVHFGTIS